MFTIATGDPANPTVALLHGLGVTGWMWEEVAALLADRFHVVAVDLPGQGRSHETPWTSLADAADLVAEEIRPDHVVGLSLGGYVALHLLARHADLVRSTVVSGVGGSPVGAPWSRPITTLAMERIVRSRTIARLSGRVMGIPPEGRELFVRDAGRLTGPTVRAIYREVLAFTPPGPVDADRLLVVAGDGDVRSLRRDLAVYAGLGACTAIVPRTTHAWPAQHPGLFARTVTRWITDRSLPAELTHAAARA